MFGDHEGVSHKPKTQTGRVERRQSTGQGFGPDVKGPRKKNSLVIGTICRMLPPQLMGLQRVGHD